MKRLDAISILTLILSIGTLVITAAGTGSIKAGGASPSPSLPMVISADGREVAALTDVVGAGEVGVLLVGAQPEPEAPDSPPSTESPVTESPVLTDCVNINTASESALTSLKGIGPTLAARITEYRRKAGRFKKKEDVMKVKGIGPAKFAAIERFICL